VVLAALAAVVVPVAPVHAETRIHGVLCWFASLTDPSAEAGTQTGEITAGPAVIDDRATPPGVHSGHFVCTIQVGAANGTHAGADAAVVTGPESTAVIAAGGTVTYNAPYYEPVWLCTEIVVDGQSLYFDDPNDPTVNGSFSTSSSAACGLAIDEGTDDPTITAIGELIDSIICPVLAIVFPPQGDIPGVWDCPPYGA
jgi:hypothetical protein